MQVREFGHASFTAVARGRDSLALSQRLIQRKRIHKLSTTAQRAQACLWAAAALWMVASCAGSGAGSPSPGTRVLTPDPLGIGLSPGMTGLVQFILTSDGVPVAGQAVSFSIDTSAAKGATLAASSAITDVRGAAAVTLMAGGEATFTVHGSCDNCTGGDSNVMVVAGGVGSLQAFPYWIDSDPPTDATEIQVALYIGSACADVDISVAAPDGPTTTKSPPKGTFLIPVVPVSRELAMVGRAHNASNTLIATGCVDVAAGSLVPDGTVDVPLPLTPLRPDPTGTFAVTSPLTFSPPLAAAAALAAPWQDLADCPLDPAQLWLDCTTDALSGSTADDPLDCVPATAAGAEGPLGDALAAGRGLLLADPAPGTPACRGGKDGSGRISLDAVTLGLFGSPLPGQVASLPAIADDAAHLLDGLTLRSTLVIAPDSLATTYVVTHTLDSARLGTLAIDLPLAPLGLPTLTAYAAGTASDGLFAIGRHGFTLRLGTVARAAFGAGLAARGFPASASKFVAALVSLARSADLASGCAALDHTICPRVGYALGCLTTACAQGIDALAARLDQAFDLANGTGLDLTLAGSAPLLFDPVGAGFANKVHLGLMTPDGKSLGTWSTVELVTSAERSTFAGTFTGVRQN
jgi:hypothetical protein